MSEFQNRYSNYLLHYGVKGMKWGVWNSETKARYAGKIGSDEPSSTKQREINDKNYTDETAKKNRRYRLKTGIATAALGAAATALGIVGIKSGEVEDGTDFTMAALGTLSFATGAFMIASEIASRKKAKRAIEVSDYVRKESKRDPKTNLLLKNSKEFTDKDVALANPYFEISDARTTNNCVCCTAALEMRHRGYEVRAKRTTTGFYENEVEKIYKGSKMSEPYKADTPWEGLSKTSAKSAVSDTLKDGGRGHLIVSWPGGGAHSVYYVCDNDRLSLYDGQTGKVLARSNEEAAKYLTRTSEVRHLRVDNCKIVMDEMKRMVE